MNQTERRRYLIEALLKEHPQYRNLAIPSDEMEAERLLRSLMNIRTPAPVSSEFLDIQDQYLQKETEGKGITDISELSPISGNFYVWQGDITTLKCDAIVNAANSGMTGCYIPCHGCIDNCIHTFAGIQLRNKCNSIMNKQGFEEPTGSAKITPAFNLPSKYIIHTVGPIVHGQLRNEDERLLASCYKSCLELASENGISSIAFCCISTGEFHFPNEQAARIAVKTVKEYAKDMKVIFNVWKDVDNEIYHKLLGQN